MSAADRFIDFVTERGLLVIALVLVITGVMMYGATFVDQDPGLDQFEFETDEADAQDYITENFEDGQNETTVQIVLQDQENALSRDSLIETLTLQEELRDDDRVNDTLTDEPFADLSSLVAGQAIRQELDARGQQLEQDQEALETTAAELTRGINETRELQQEFTALNASRDAGEITQEEYTEQAAQLESELNAVADDTTAGLDAAERAAYEELLVDARDIEREFATVEAQFQAGELTEQEREQQFDTLESELETVYDRIETAVLADRIDELDQRAATLEADSDALRTGDLTIEQQREQLEEMTDEDVEAVVDTLVADGANRQALVFLPTSSYEPGDDSVDARTLFVTQSTQQAEIVEGEAPDRIVDSQLAIAEVVKDRFDDGGFAFGLGILTDEIDRSFVDSLTIVLPLSLLFVVIVLSVAYRDPLDILLGVLGIALVLIWTFGFMGWTGISFNQIMISVPVLLVGLSIDYAIHVFMRHREQRGEDDGETIPSMQIVLSGLGVALVWVTVTAVIGFLANLVNPIQPIREFGVASAFGIFATLIVFTTFVPATKVTLDEFLEGRGWDRQKRAFGTGGGAFTRVLSVGRNAARRSPWTVVFVALLITGAGLAGATQVDTTFEQEDFIADDPPDWMKSLPAGIAPGDYAVKDQLAFVNERFIRQDTSTQVLLPRPGAETGDITRDNTLERVHAAEQAAEEQDVIVRLSGDAGPDVQSPLSVMRTVAGNDETFNETFRAADTSGPDGVPSENLTAVYDALFAADEQRASQVIHRTDDGEYEAARLQISIRGDTTAGDAKDATESVAGIATGQLVIFSIIEDELFNAVIEGLLVTLVAVFVFLMIAYRIFQGSATLGAVTLTPIVLTVAWILGTMYLLDIPFNVITGTITSLTIGLGVAYNIHMSERYQLELGRQGDVWDAMERAVTGTGGALLGSAATTAGGFGVLAFAIIPPLQQFGIITGITIIYAFLGSVFVLPSFLVLWTKYLGPDGLFPDDEPPSDETAADTDGAVSTDVTTPTRSVQPSVADSGDAVSVTLELPDVAGRAIIEERSPLDSVQIEAVQPDVVDAVEIGQQLYVHIEREQPGPVVVEYSGRVPDDVEPGEHSFGGTVSVDDRQTGIDGAVAIDIVEQGFERDLRRGGVSTGELRAAGEALRDGQLTEKQYRRVAEDWVQAHHENTEEQLSQQGEAARSDDVTK